MSLFHRNISAIDLTNYKHMNSISLSHVHERGELQLHTLHWKRGKYLFHFTFYPPCWNQSPVSITSKTLNLKVLPCCYWYQIYKPSNIQSFCNVGYISFCKYIAEDNLTIETQRENPALTLEKQESEEIKTASLNLWELIYSVRSGSPSLACVDLHFLIVRDISQGISDRSLSFIVKSDVQHFVFYLNIAYY